MTRWVPARPSRLPVHVATASAQVMWWPNGVRFRIDAGVSVGALGSSFAFDRPVHWVVVDGTATFGDGRVFGPGDMFWAGAGQVHGDTERVQAEHEEAVRQGLLEEPKLVPAVHPVGALVLEPRDGTKDLQIKTTPSIP